MKKICIALVCLLAATNLYSQEIPLNTAAKSENTSGDHALLFSVIQDEFSLNNKTVKDASIIEDAGVYKGLHIELKPEAAKQFTEITQAGTGRKLNLVFNKIVVTTTVIQSALSGNFVISGITRQDAQSFINMLNANKPKPEEDATA